VGAEQRADRGPVVTDPTAGEPTDAPRTKDPDTHTAALQGAAAGGAGSETGAGYAAGLLTGSEDGIGMREIPDEEDAASDDA
jgi:hypothetical protein